MEQFIREKIKDKPLNKKRLAKKAGTAALCGVAFAVAASIVFAIFLPVINRQSKKASDGKNNNDVQTATQQSGIDDSSDAYSENGTQSTESGTSSEPSSQTYQPTLADYQAVQNQLYRVGASATKFVVGVTGVTDATDIFNNSYETEGQGVGVILRDNGKQLIILTEKNVVDKADKLSVTFVNDMMADAALVKYDSNTGIAIISVDKSLLDDATIRAIAVAELGNSNIVSRGASVIALEANYAILTGLVTSTTNELSAQDNNYSVLTTDIASNKLQSGILINTDGQVIGLSLQDFNPAEENNTLTAVSISDLSPAIEKLESGADVPYIGADGFCSPIGSGWERRVTSEFGNRVDPITGKRKGHGGMDLAVPTGTPIRAALPGTVTVSKYNAGGYGYYVMIDHGNGLATLYGHCSKLLAKVGQTVEAGDIIALSGSTGRSTGPHLHFEVRVNGERTNPRAYLPKG